MVARKLISKEIKEIRSAGIRREAIREELLTLTNRALATKYRVSQSTIERIMRGDIYADEQIPTQITANDFLTNSY